MTPPQVPSRRRIREIADLAQQAVELHSPGGVTVEPAGIAEKLELPVLPGDYSGAFDGLLECRDGRFYIYYDAARLGGLEQPRVRFTLGHELGHWFLDEHRGCLEDGVDPHKCWTGFESKNPVEREADYFASFLLVPPGQLREFAWGREPDLPLVLSIADRFQISRSAAAVRYVVADYYGCGVVRLDSDGNRKWSWSSETLADRVYPTMRASLKGLKPTDGTVRRFEEARLSRDPTEGGVVQASTWFTYAEGDRDLELYEEMVSLGRYGVLVFLSTTE